MHAWEILQLMMCGAFAWQDRYCVMSSTYGNSTSGTFKHPAEIFNLEKLLTVGAKDPDVTQNLKLSQEKP